MQASELPGGERTTLVTVSAPILNHIEAGASIVQWETGLSKQWTILDKMGKVTSPVKEELVKMVNRSSFSLSAGLSREAVMIELCGLGN